jgi:hypothetical protein
MVTKVKLTAPDALSEAQRRYFERYVREVSSGAVCVNVLVGTDHWDLRPLILEAGKVWLYRFTRTLDPDVIRDIATEWAGFTVVPGITLQVKRPEQLDQLLVIRPYYQATLADAIRVGELDNQRVRRSVVAGILEHLGALIRRNLVHGHLSLSNFALVDGKVNLLDPRIGVLHGVVDDFIAPEITAKADPPPSADLFGVGKMLATLLAESATDEEREIIDQLTLPSPRQRPSFSVLQEVFGLQADSLNRSAPYNAKSALRSAHRDTSTSTELPPRSASQPAAGGDSPVLDIASQMGRRYWKPAAIGAAVLGMALFVSERRYPSVYYELAHLLPFLAAESDPEFDEAWASGERVKLARTARAALIDRIPAAENAIVRSVVDEGKMPFPQAEILRRALDPSWRSELSRSDIRAALALGLAPLVPDAARDLPPLRDLHPAVIFAVSGAAGTQDPGRPPSGLKGVPVSVLVQLPDPLGSLFDRFESVFPGVTLDDSRALALSALAAGYPNLERAVDAYCAPVSNSVQQRDLLSLILPILRTNEASVLGAARPEEVSSENTRAQVLARTLSAQVVAALKSNGSTLGDSLAWFDIEPIANWDKVPATSRLVITLGAVPAQGLGISHYADLLLYPESDIRKEAARFLTERVFKEGGENMLLFLSGSQNRFSREQTISLISAVSPKTERGKEWISTWFGALSPEPNAVLLLLLSRSNLVNDDGFNLEAARFLRKSEWSATPALLDLLASHPEPLARSLAYARLDATDPGQMKILRERLSKETDAGLKKSIEMRLRGSSQKGKES